MNLSQLLKIMVDKITKFLSKLNKKERQIILWILKAIRDWNVRGLDMKKLTGYKNLYRIRKWKIRIVIRKENTYVEILEINTRWHIYKKLNF